MSPLLRLRRGFVPATIFRPSALGRAHRPTTPARGLRSRDRISECRWAVTRLRPTTPARGLRSRDMQCPVGAGRHTFPTTPAQGLRACDHLFSVGWRPNGRSSSTAPPRPTTPARGLRSRDVCRRGRSAANALRLRRGFVPATRLRAIVQGRRSYSPCLRRGFVPATWSGSRPTVRPRAEEESP